LEADRHCDEWCRFLFVDQGALLGESFEDLKNAT
jgi:hypothetical protein